MPGLPRVFLLIAVMALCPAPASAQWMVGGGVMKSWQNPVTFQSSAPSLPDRGIGGHSVGLILTGGGPVARRVGWRADLAIPKRFSYETTSTMFHAQGTYRDIVLSGLTSFYPLPRFAFLIGESFIREQIERGLAVSYVGEPFPPIRRPFGTENSHAWAFSTGAEFGFPVTPQFSIVPQLKLHVVHRAEQDFSLGLGRFEVQPAVIGRFERR